MSTKIYFIRHGESTGNVTGRFYDSPKACLTAKGKNQASDVGQIIRQEVGRVNFIYCSPWDRAQETCQIALRVSEISYKEIIFDKRIRERSFAGVIGKRINNDGKYDSCNDAISLDEYRELWTYGSPIQEQFGVETLFSLRQRTKEFLDDISKCHPNEAVLISSHGGLGLMMQALCEEWPEGGCFWKMEYLKNGEIAEWTYG